MRKGNSMTNIRHERVAIVAGVGPGLGAALVRKLAQEGCRVGMFARSPHFIGKLVAGATSSVRGRGGAVAFSSAKFAVRGLAQSLAVELWPKGIHVAHVIIDGVIDTPKVRRTYKPSAKEPLLQPEAVADSYWNL